MEGILLGIVVGPVTGAVDEVVGQLFTGAAQ